MTPSPLPIFGSADTLLWTILSDYFSSQPNVHVGTLFTEDLEPPFLIARQERRSGTMANQVPDERFLQPVVMSINTITDGVDADEANAELQEACRQAIWEAQSDQIVVPGHGSISWIDNTTIPSRTSDWATSTGVVQYASLPKGWVRYESIYRLIIRPPSNRSSVSNRFIRPPR